MAPRATFDDPRLPGALKLLRHAARLTQREVAEAAQGAGGALSHVYYRQLEAGMRAPTLATLDLVLAALGADRGALDAALREAGEGATGMRRTARQLPKPRAYLEAADAALAAGPWSSPVAPPRQVASPAPVPGPGDAVPGPEARLLAAFRRLDPEGRAAVLRLAERLAQQT